MSTRYLFNTAGNYVAFVQGGYVFAPNADWIGFLQHGNLFYGADGTFKGYVLEDDRVARNVLELPRPRQSVPGRPLRPLRPLKPLRRLRATRFQYPYQDVFENGTTGVSTEGTTHNQSFDEFEGSSLQGADGTFLGTVTRDKYDQNSLANKYGAFGNPYNALSIFNKYGQYGGRYSSLSPFNEYSDNPPRIVRNGSILTYLTTNKYISPRIDPVAFQSWLGR